MRKKSKAMHRDFSKYDATQLEYYGILMKDQRVRVDTKRYRKFFEIPDKKIEHRKTIYYIPSKIHATDYICNVFRMEVNRIKQLWINEYSRAIKLIKTPKDIESNSRLANISNGILEYDEVEMNAKFAAIKRDPQYRLVIKSLYAQFFHQFMSDIDALCLRVITSQGYSSDDFTKKNFDIFIQGKQTTKPAIDFRKYANYQIYDEAYCVWNFLKHNSLSAYNFLKTTYPQRIYDPNVNYQNGQSALSVLKLDEKYILHVLDNICNFFDEVCVLGFKENPKDAQWDYDDYFLNQANDEIENIVNPLGLPDWL